MGSARVDGAVCAGVGAAELIQINLVGFPRRDVGWWSRKERTAPADLVRFAPPARPVRAARDGYLGLFRGRFMCRVLD